MEAGFVACTNNGERPLWTQTTVISLADFG
jgi:hypothetical protein